MESAPRSSVEAWAEGNPPPRTFDEGKAREAQRRIARMVRLSSEPLEVRTVCGIDVSYRGSAGVGAAVTLSFPDLEPVEEKVVFGRARVPYVPTFLAFREMGFYHALFSRLESKPSVFLIDGHGICHPEFAGAASHFGVTFGVPSIGVAKGLPRIAGVSREGGDVLIRGRAVAREVRRAGGSARPLYVSPGHLVDLEGAVAIVKKSFRGHRSPEPLFLADRISREAVSRGG